MVGSRNGKHRARPEPRAVGPYRINITRGSSVKLRQPSCAKVKCASAREGWPPPRVQPLGDGPSRRTNTSCRRPRGPCLTLGAIRLFALRRRVKRREGVESRLRGGGYPPHTQFDSQAQWTKSHAAGLALGLLSRGCRNGWFVTGTAWNIGQKHVGQNGCVAGRRLSFAPAGHDRGIESNAPASTDQQARCRPLDRPSPDYS